MPHGSSAALRCASLPGEAKETLVGSDLSLTLGVGADAWLESWWADPAARC